MNQNNSYNGVYPFIDTYEGIKNTLETIETEIERGMRLNPNSDLEKTVKLIKEARAMLWSYEGVVDPN